MAKLYKTNIYRINTGFGAVSVNDLPKPLFRKCGKRLDMRYKTNRQILAYSEALRVKAAEHYTKRLEWVGKRPPMSFAEWRANG